MFYMITLKRVKKIGFFLTPLLHRKLVEADNQVHLTLSVDVRTLPRLVRSFGPSIFKDGEDTGFWRNPFPFPSNNLLIPSFAPTLSLSVSQGPVIIYV